MQGINRFLAWTALVLVGLVGVLRATALRWWQVPTGDPELEASIAPTLHGGDWVLLWRLTRPALGDLVVCPDPADPTNVVIGRIVAEANDRVLIQGPDVEVNGHRFDIEYNCTERTFKVTDPDSLKEVELYCDMENVGDTLHMRGYGAAKKDAAKFAKQISSGNAFLLSDNRMHPFDSRHFGTVDRRTCTEKVFFRLVSKDGFFDAANRLSSIR
ncbi:MAG TPA: signal peptidase I [Polyangiaceae bacterium]|nr:signal peptidase I [Polyangiaceae bacterium]